MRFPDSLIRYDSARKRLWIAGQRCHHGATGVVITGVAAVGLAATRLKLVRCFGLAATGSLLIAHDWKDRSMWFERGEGSQD